MDYHDFEVAIGNGSGRSYPVTVVKSPVGEARGTMVFPFDDRDLTIQLLSLQNSLLRSSSPLRQVFLPEKQEQRPSIQNFGQALFDALFAGDVRILYVASKEKVGQRKGLRLKLRIQPPELAFLPWEFLYDPTESDYICLSNRTPIVRYPEVARSVPLLPVPSPLSILAMTASPKDLPGLDVMQEKQRVETALRDARGEGRIQISWVPGGRWRDLLDAMRGGPWHIFHFIGHGGFDARTQEGLIVLEDDEGKANQLSATQLGRLLTDHRTLRLVILNSCEGARESVRDIFSSTATMLIRRGIPAVLAMQFEISDRAAIELSRTFYEALAEGLPVDMAVSEARRAMSLGLANTLEWGIPVLYMRSPDGRLFGKGQVHLQKQSRPNRSVSRQASARNSLFGSGAEGAIETMNEVSMQSREREVHSIQGPVAIPAATQPASDPPIRVVDRYAQGNYTTITQALKEARPGDRILVRPGEYEETLDIDKPVEIIGDGDPGTVTVKIAGADVIVFRAPKGRLANLVLRQMGEGKWYGVDIRRGQLELMECDITSDSLACIAIQTRADPWVHHNRIHDGASSGVTVFAKGRGTLEDNDIFGNTNAGVSIESGGDPVLRRNHIHDGASSGVFIYDDGLGTLEENKIIGNVNSGISVESGSEPIVRRNLVNHNYLFGVRIDAAGGTFEDNDLRHNRRGAWSISAESESKVRRLNNQE